MGAMKRLIAMVLMLCCGSALAREPVVSASDPEALFADPDPQLHANKQVALHMMRELLQ